MEPTASVSPTFHEDAESAESLTEGKIFEVLSNRRRRYVLQYLEQQDSDVVSIQDLSDQTAAWEYNKSIACLTSTERKRVKNALHQFHLPKMDDCGFLEYDAQRGLVTLTEAAADLEVYIEIVPTMDIPWGPYYVLLTGLHIPVVVGHWFGVSPIRQIPLAAILIFFLAAMLVSALVHTYFSYTRMRLTASPEAPEVEQ